MTAEAFVERHGPALLRCPVGCRTTPSTAPAPRRSGPTRLCSAAPSTSPRRSPAVGASCPSACTMCACREAIRTPTLAPVPYRTPTAAPSLSRFCADPRSHVRLGLVHRRLRRGRCRQRLGENEVRCQTRGALPALPAGCRRARVCHASRALAQHLHVRGRSPVGALSRALYAGRWTNNGPDGGSRLVKWDGSHG